MRARGRPAERWPARRLLKRSGRGDPATLEAKHFAERVEMPVVVQHTHVLPRGRSGNQRVLENLECDDRRDSQLVAPQSGRPIRRYQRMLGANPDRRVEQVDPVGRQRHESGRLPQASSFNAASISGIGPGPFVVRSISASIFSRRALDRIGPMPFDAERPLAPDAGSTVAVGFLVVAMNPG
jgi:hypothetical protein